MSDGPIPNPELAPAAPAIVQDEGRYVLDGARVPRYDPSPCTGCKFFWYFGTAADSRQVYVDPKDGIEKRRIYAVWHRFCTNGPEMTEFADDLVAYCNKFTPDLAAENAWRALTGREPGRNPEIAR